MKKALTLFYCLIFIIPAYSQIQPNSELFQEKIEKLSFMLGDWKGDGWVFTQQGKRETFIQSEKVTLEANKEAILVKGQGTHKAGSDDSIQTIHDAIALISYNPQTDIYDFRSIAMGRGSGNYAAKLLNERVLEWTMEVPNGQIIYTIDFTKEETWYEIGEFVRDGNRRKFFEMTLSRVN